jgi:hypothetical protein
MYEVKNSLQNQKSTGKLLRKRVHFLTTNTYIQVVTDKVFPNANNDVIDKMEVL